jgi:alpha-glucosidase/alpha-D-xyloside xylohydrolase
MGFLEGQNDPPRQEEMNNPAIEPVARKYAELRYQLLPYTYTLTREAYDTGMPLMRALWLHYPSDNQARGQSQEYLWGRDLLIAPVYEQGATSRDVYLPQGVWYDWWNNARHEGGRNVTREVDLATMPIFARAGSIIPLDPVRQYTGEQVDGPTTLKVYRGADGQFTMYADDGISQDYLQNRGGSWTRMTWDDGARRLVLEPGAPAGVSNVAANRAFKVELIPDGTTRDVRYTGQRVEVTF